MSPEPAKMPERFIQPDKRLVKDMRVGDTGWIDPTSVYVDEDTHETFISTEDNSDLKKRNTVFYVFIESVENGFKLVFCERNVLGIKTTFMKLSNKRRQTAKMIPVTSIEIVDEEHLPA